MLPVAVVAIAVSPPVAVTVIAAVVKVIAVVVTVIAVVVTVIAVVMA